MQGNHECLANRKRFRKLYKQRIIPKYHETFLTSLEEERPDEMEVAKKEDEEGKEKAIEEVNNILLIFVAVSCGAVGVGIS